MTTTGWSPSLAVVRIIDHAAHLRAHAERLKVSARNGQDVDQLRLLRWSMKP